MGAIADEGFTKAKLRQTLAELIEREAKLQPFVTEVEEVRAAIKVIEAELIKEGKAVRIGRGSYGLASPIDPNE